MGKIEGKKFRIRVLGCRTNQYEAEAVASALVLRGARPSEEEWDVAVLLSCTVTSEADRKCRQQVRRLRRENPQGVIVAAGCWAQELDEEEGAKIGLDAIVGNRLKSALPEILEKILAEGTRPRAPVVCRLPSPPNGDWDKLSVERTTLRTRAFIKVQEGCDHYCSYCIVPYVRGGPVSRDSGEILEEVRRVAVAGCREVVLTGVHLGLYRHGEGGGLARLVREIAKTPGICRIRFGSIEPFALDENLVRTLAETPGFCPHLHLPLQSGDDGVLRAMRRGYSAAEFRRIVEKVRGLWREKIHFSTDLLVGFPGESDAAFENTLALVRELEFGKLHVFPYSRRPGTEAACMEGQVPEAVVRARCEAGIRLGENLLERYAASFIGKTVPVLVEKRKGKEARGLTPHFLPVHWNGGGETGGVCDVEVKGYKSGKLLG
ncbi:MAG: tRNA (N(6)-L-threonylcarbamoyladenosine(37)-C(2))-methylthiotransferase MtaB [Synergistaceae bacterium]|nr:tRNA (N(6)-L-threonylcarbamoyladenosine(37)-C(2))-methylthiotransferase MtaB [Synergistaceae bacterium]